MSKTTLDLSTISDISDGTHTVKVKAKADGYRDSEFSNEVNYTKSSSFTITFEQNFSRTATYNPTYVKVNNPPTSDNDNTIQSLPYPGLTGKNPVSGVTRLYVWGYGYVNSAGETILLNDSSYNNAVEIPVSSNGTFVLVCKGND